MKQISLIAAVLIALSAILLTVNGRPRVLEDQLEKIKDTGNEDVPLEMYSINNPHYEGVFDGDGFSYNGKHFVPQINKTSHIRQIEDMMFRVEEPDDEDDSDEDRGKRNAIRPHPFGPTLWENGVVPYEITSAFDDCEKRIILQAMRHMEEKTCIRFRERTSSDAYYVTVVTSRAGDCRSYVGRQHRNFQPQELFLGPGCVSIRTVVHEFGHAIGFYHEHNRPDRDQYITVIRGNIWPGSVSAYEVDNGDTLGFGYDYASIMHYSNRAFSVDGRKETMQPKSPNIPLGGADELSPLDILKINKLYSCPCPQTAPTTVVPPPCNIELQGAPSCGSVNVLTGDQAQTVSSPGYPAHRHNQRCAWVFSCPSGYVPQVELPGFRLEESAGCTKDYVRIHYGASLESTSIARFRGLTEGRICLNRYQNRRFFLGASSITLLYVTDGSGSGNTGLRARITCIDEDECRSFHRCHTCQNSGGSFDCSCNNGYYPSKEARTCYDRNECAYQNGGCQDRCVNLGGSYRCECSSGFLQADGKSCGSSRPSSTRQPTAPALPEVCSTTSECPALTNPTNGRVSAPSRSVNSRATYSCNSGYTLSGSSTRTCQSGGTWSGSAPTCQLRQCPTLANPTDGTVSTSSRTVGGRATYSCDSGYILSGSSTRTCQSGETWSGSAPTCNIDPSVSAKLYFRLGSQTYQSRSEVLISDIGEQDNALLCTTESTRCCGSPYLIGEFYYPDGRPVGLRSSGDPLYRNRGQGFIRLNRRFSANSPLGLYKCAIPDSSGTFINIYINIIQGCPALTNPTNGRVSFPSRSINSRATYSCNSGYTLSGSSTRTCQSGGRWSGSAPTCQGRSCPTLSNPSNGRVVVSSSSVGGRATYSCNSGYTLSGSSTRTCQSGGTWSGSTPTCQRRSCPTLSNPSNGRVAVSSTSVGGTATYSCNSGYNLVGSSRRTCQSGGTWSGSTPTCQLRPCPTLSNPSNGRVAVSSTSVGGTATYSCNSGYNLVGSSRRTCQSGGTWSGSAPTCSRDVPLTSQMYFRLGDQTYQNGANCPMSDIGEASNALLCMTDNTNCCNAPHLIGEFYYPDGSRVGVRASGDSLYRNRRQGYIRLNRRNGATSPLGRYRCDIPNSNGVMQSIYINIVGGQTCPTLLNPSNGRVVVSSSSVGGTATYSCNSGYTLSGSSTRTCQSGGTWSGRAPTCQSRPCPSLSIPSNGRVAVSSTSVGGTATYSCNSGYNLVGSSRRTCQSGGTWSGSAPTCQSRSCPILSNPSNGRVVVSSSSVGGTATYSCNSGYNLVGSSRRTCQSGGTWSGSVPTCQSRPCPTLSNPSNGRVAVSSTSVGGTATYSCNSGYNLVGSSRRTCQSGGTWSGSVPTCQSRSCPTLSNPSNGRVAVSSTSVGGTATYSCNSGYSLVGSSRRTCQSGGTWSGSAPTCSRDVPLTSQMYFRLGDQTYQNGANCPMSDIGEASNALLCMTDNTNCCNAPHLIGEFYYPDGSRVGVRASGDSLYRNRGQGYIRLNRRNGATSPLGRYRCDIPDSNGVMQSIYINIVDNKPVTCPTLTSPANGAVSAPARTVGSVATYSCSSGYTLSGGTTRTCQSSGEWSGLQPSCQARPCPTLSNPSNGRVAVSSTSVGGTATYSCNSGYNLVGSSRRTCQSGGTWSGSTPTCQATSTASFYLRGQRYPAGSSISLSSIGEGDSAALIFRTSNPNCCRTQKLGECYYPDGSQVGIRATSDELYRNRGEQLIRLNRQASPRGRRATTGLYCCNVPDEGNVCVNITA